MTVESPTRLTPRDPHGATALVWQSRRSFHEDVRDLAIELLAGDEHTRAAAARRRLTEPMRYTLERRRDYFPGAFALAAGAVASPADARFAAAAIEIGWAWILVVDDLVDEARRRDGHVPAHAVFGAARSAVAVLVSFGLLFDAIARQGALSPRARLRWLGSGTLCGFGGLWGQRPPLRRRFAARPYLRKARASGRVVEWALLAVLRELLDGPGVRALRRYTAAHGAVEKIRNDLADYCGCSAGRIARFSDFHDRRVTYPVVALMAEPLEAHERAGIERHFGSRGGPPLRLEEALRVFERHGVFDLCLDAMRAQLDAAHAAVADLTRACPETAPVAEFLLRWERETIERTERDVAACVSGQSNSPRLARLGSAP